MWEKGSYAACEHKAQIACASTQSNWGMFSIVLFIKMILFCKKLLRSDCINARLFWAFTVHICEKGTFLIVNSWKVIKYFLTIIIKENNKNEC